MHDRQSVYLGHESQVTRTAATCVGCAMGCGIQAITRDNQLLRVEGDWDAPNGGLLCAAGRFEVVEPKPARILQPLIKRDGQQVEANWDEALALRGGRNSARRIWSPASRRRGSRRNRSRRLNVFSTTFWKAAKSRCCRAKCRRWISARWRRCAMWRNPIASRLSAAIPAQHQKVLRHLILRALDNGARLLIVNDESTGIDPWAELHLDLEDISFHAASPFEKLRTTYHLRVSGVLQLRKALEPAQRPVLLYGSGLSSTVYAALRSLPEKARFLPLVTGANAVGAARLGLEARPVRGDVLYVLLGDDLPDGQALPQSEFTVVQAACRSPWTDAADVVLPSPTWAEQRGHVVNLEGRRLPVVPLLQAPPSVQPHLQTFAKLAERMGA